MGRYAAVDLGAGSGRVIVGELTEGCLLTCEVHRFRNDPVPLPEAGGVRLCWKATELFAQVRAGLSKAAAQGPLEAIGIDTWGVDYGLLDVDGVLTAPVVSYRDRRTAGVPSRVFEQIDPAVLYARTGTQVQESTPSSSSSRPPGVGPSPAPIVCSSCPTCWPTGSPGWRAPR